MTPSIQSELHRSTINKSESEVSDSAKASLTFEQKLIDGPEVASGSDTEEEDKEEEDKKEEVKHEESDKPMIGKTKGEEEEDEDEQENEELMKRMQRKTMQLMTIQ